MSFLQESADDDVVELVSNFKEERDAGTLVPIFKEKVGDYPIVNSLKLFPS